MPGRLRMIFKRGFPGHLLRCNGGESLSHKRFFQNLSSAARKEALDLLNVPGTSTDPASYTLVLKLLGSQKALQEGKCIHHLIISVALDLDRFVVGYLVQMYGACALFDDAFNLFYKMQERSVFVWNFVIRACARQGEHERVLNLLEQMQQEGIIPTKVTFVSVFDACTGLIDFVIGQRMHALIVNSPVEVDVVVGTALVNMYCSYGYMAVAWLCFDKLLERDVIAWTALISALSQQARKREVFGLFEQMLQEGIMPNEVTFIGLCGACADHVSLPDGERVHARVSSFAEIMNVELENALITMYGKCGCLEPAESIFRAMRARSLVSWTAMISAFSRLGYGKEAHQHFFHMLQLAYLPDNVLFTTILAACASSSLLAICKHMHAMLSIMNSDMDALLGTVLVNTYGKCRDVELANATFDSLSDRNVFAWNAVIAAFTQNSKDHVADKLFHRMQEEGILPNKVTFVSVLSVYGNNPLLFQHGVQLHTCISLQEVEVRNALIDMYGKNGRLDAAQFIFDTITERDSITWTVLIAAYVQYGQTKEALCMFDRMCEEGLQPDEATFVSILSACDSEVALVRGQQIHAFILEGNFESDVVVSTALVSMYGRCNSVEDARLVFDRMAKRNGVSWNAMIAIYEQAGKLMEALELFKEMQCDRVLPDYVTFVTVVSLCTAQLALVEGMVVHAYILESGCMVDVVLISAIINMYGKSGSLGDAQRVFDKMQERNVVSWNTMIALYAQHGLGLGAFAVFDEMQASAMLPNHTTFVNILGACSHCGFLYEACHCFLTMGEVFMLYPTADVFVCLIDLLGRAGCLDEAEILVSEMPVLPSSVSFMALLGACRYREDVERGVCAAKHASEMEPDNRTPHLILSNLYAAVGRVGDAALVMSLFEDAIKEGGFILDDGEWHDVYESIGC